MLRNLALFGLRKEFHSTAVTQLRFSTPYEEKKTAYSSGTKYCVEKVVCDFIFPNTGSTGS